MTPNPVPFKLESHQPPFRSGSGPELPPELCQAVNLTELLVPHLQRFGSHADVLSAATVVGSWYLDNHG